MSKENYDKCMTCLDIIELELNKIAAMKSFCPLDYKVYGCTVT